jgi:hypothetical protein
VSGASLAFNLFCPCCQDYDRCVTNKPSLARAGELAHEFPRTDSLSHTDRERIGRMRGEVPDKQTNKRAASMGNCELYTHRLCLAPDVPCLVKHGRPAACHALPHLSTHTGAQMLSTSKHTCTRTHTHLVALPIVAPLLAGMHPTVQHLATGAATQGGLLVTLEPRVQGLATGAVALSLLRAGPAGA